MYLTRLRFQASAHETPAFARDQFLELRALPLAGGNLVSTAAVTMLMEEPSTLLRGNLAQGMLNKFLTRAGVETQAFAILAFNLGWINHGGQTAGCGS